MKTRSEETQLSSALSADRVSVTFGGVKAVRDATFSLPLGRLYGIVGPNGSGKTSLLNALSRVVPLAGGTLQIAGIDYTKRRDDEVAKLGIARTFQSIRLLKSLSVLENVQLGADVQVGRVRGADWWIGRRGARAREVHGASIARDALSRVGIPPRVWMASPAELPYGAQRLVEIARTIAMNPKVLLLDEPTAGMREDERSEVMTLAQSLVKDGMSVLLVDHNLRMINEICERVIVMNFGEVIQEGEPRIVMRDPVVRRAYLGGDG